MKIGITERGDAAYNLKWIPWVKSGKPAILISKNPEKLYSIVKQFDKPNIIVHCTITGNGGTEMEPNVLPFEKSLESYYDFVEYLGKDRVVLRIDPIIPEEPYLVNSLSVLSSAKERLKENMTRVRISFIDNYEHVKERMSNAGMKQFSFEFNAPLKQRIEIWEKMEKPLLCGEKDMPTTGCLSEEDCKILGVEPETGKSGQRNACGCLSNKHELLDTPEQCESACLFCYWKKEHKRGGLF